MVKGIAPSPCLAARPRRCSLYFGVCARLRLRSTSELSTVSREPFSIATEEASDQKFRCSAEESFVHGSELVINDDDTGVVDGAAFKRCR